MKPRTWIVARAQAGQRLAEVLQKCLALSRWQIRQLRRDAQSILLDGLPCHNLDQRVRCGQRVQLRSGSAEPKQEAGPDPVVRYADSHIAVVDKPAGLTTVRHAEEVAEFGSRARRYLPPTLADVLPKLLDHGKAARPARVRAVHRLDRDTSGLVVFARSAEAERMLGIQFRAHSIERRYLALVRGRAENRSIESNLVADRGDGRRGSSIKAGAGQHAVTHVKVVERLGEFTLVECRLETGRTHQVRIHLGESGTPLCGERVYDRPLHGKPVLPDASGLSRPALHAAFLEFQHPQTGNRVSWTSPLPNDLRDTVERLRKTKK